jgi:hypothetical protein
MKKFAINEDELSQLYGEFYPASPGTKFDILNVPENLRQLAPYAAFWGLADDLEREHLVNIAPTNIARELRDIVASFDDALDEWLTGAEADSDCPSDAYVAFSCLRMAADFV